MNVHRIGEVGGAVEPLAALAQAAVARGARAALLVIELPDGSTEMLAYPDLSSVRVGLAIAAVDITRGDAP